MQSLEAGWVPNERYADPAFRITFARLVAHYFHHCAWLGQDQLLQEAHRLTGTPGVLVHGRMDLGGPADAAWQLAQAWPEAELQLVDTGHGGGDEMTAASDRSDQPLRRPALRPYSGVGPDLDLCARSARRATGRRR